MENNPSIRAPQALVYALGIAALAFILSAPFASVAHAAGNLISNPSFEQSGTNGNPLDWIRGRWGTNTAVFSYPVAGGDGQKAASVQMTSYVSGDAKWAFKPVAVQEGKEYRFSNSYMSSSTTYVTAEFKYGNGSTSYRDLLVLTPSESWKNTSATFTVPTGAVTVSVYHVIKSVGTLSVDEYRLEETDTPPPPPPPPADPNNLIVNPSLEFADSSGNPAAWTKGKWGTNTAIFDYPVGGQDGARGARIRMTARTTGDAKWSFKEVPIEGGRMYKFTNYYMSDVPTYLTLRYKMSDGTYRYPDLAMLPAASSWERTEHTFTAPSGAVAVTVFHLINQVGFLTVDAFGLSETGTPAGPPKGIVTLSFDDGWRSVYETAIPILNAAGLKSTQYIITGRFSFPSYVNQSEVLQMQAQGHEIGAHTITHRDLTVMPLSEAKLEIEKSKQDLIGIGVNAVSSFSYPFGAYNDGVKQLVMDAGFVTARSTDSGFNQKGVLNAFALKRQPVNVYHTPAQVKAWIDEAVAKDQWLILAFHRIDYEGTTYSATPETLQEIVNYLKSKGIKVVTVSEGFEIMK